MIFSRFLEGRGPVRRMKHVAARISFLWRFIHVCLPGDSMTVMVSPSDLLER